MEACVRFNRRVLLNSVLGSGVAALAACDARVRNEEKHPSKRKSR